MTRAAQIEEVNPMITPRAHVYSHKWAPPVRRVGQRCTLHRATGFDEARLKRVMRGCTIVGDKPF